MTAKEVAKKAIAKFIAENKTWNQEASFLAIKAVMEHLSGKEEPELRGAIWELLNTSAFAQKCEKAGIIPKRASREGTKVDSLLAGLDL